MCCHARNLLLDIQCFTAQCIACASKHHSLMALLPLSVCVEAVEQLKAMVVIKTCLPFRASKLLVLHHKKGTVPQRRFDVKHLVCALHICAVVRRSRSGSASSNDCVYRFHFPESDKTSAAVWRGQSATEVRRRQAQGMRNDGRASSARSHCVARKRARAHVPPVPCSSTAGVAL